MTAAVGSIPMRQVVCRVRRDLCCREPPHAEVDAVDDVSSHERFAGDRRRLLARGTARPAHRNLFEAPIATHRVAARLMGRRSRVVIAVRADIRLGLVVKP